MGATIPSLRRFFPAFIALLILGLLFLAIRDAVGRSSVGTIDLLQYYAGARLWLVGRNPYDPSLIELVERSVSTDPAIPVLLWNPPEILPIIAPLGLMSFHNAVAFWMLLAVLSIAISVKIGLRVFKPQNLSKKVFQVGVLCTFYPFALCVGYGQISFLLLLGLSFFLLRVIRYGESITGSFVGGIFLSLVAVKPHLLYLIFIFLVVLSIRSRSWGSILGFLAGAVTLNLIATIGAPDIHSWYQVRMALPPIYWQTPTLGSWLQGLTNVNQPWIRIMPTLLMSGATLILFFRIPRESLDHKLFLALIPLSLLTSPYGWTYDHMLMLPTMLWLIKESRSNIVPILLVVLNLLVCLTPAQWGQQTLVWYPAAVAAIALLHLTTAQKSQIS